MSKKRKIKLISENSKIVAEDEVNRFLEGEIHDEDIHFDTTSNKKGETIFSFAIKYSEGA